MIGAIIYSCLVVALVVWVGKKFFSGDDRKKDWSHSYLEQTDILDDL